MKNINKAFLIGRVMGWSWVLANVVLTFLLVGSFVLGIMWILGGETSHDWGYRAQSCFEFAKGVLIPWLIIVLPHIVWMAVSYYKDKRGEL